MVEQFGTTCYLINVPQWPHSICDGPAWLDRVGKKPSVKADLLIYSNCVTVSGQCLSVAIMVPLNVCSPHDMVRVAVATCLAHTAHNLVACV